MRHYGPDLSSLQHLDGKWLHVLPPNLSLEVRGKSLVQTYKYCR